MITPENLISELNNTITDLLIIQSKLEDYAAGPPLPVDEIEILESELAAVMEPVPDFIDFIVKSKPDPAIIGDRLKDCFTIPTTILSLLIEIRKKSIPQ